MRPLRASWLVVRRVTATCHIRHVAPGIGSLGTRAGIGSPRSLHASRPILAKQPFKLGDIGEGIAEVEIIQWFVKPPCKIEEFDPIVEVSSDKATVEITSPYSGQILATHGDVGGIVKVGDTIADIDVPDAVASEEVTSSSPDSQPGSAPDSAPLPTQVAASTPTESEMSGQEKPDMGSSSRSSSSGKLAGPATRFLARQHGVDISQINGTGPSGRVLKGDVMAAVQSRDQPKAPSPPEQSASAPAEAQRIPLEPHRKNMFKAMTAWQSVAPFGYADEVDVTELERVRIVLNEHIPLRYRATLPRGVSEVRDRVDADGRIDRITLLPLLLKALSQAMHEHPLFASQLVDAGTPEAALLRRPQHDISIALSAPDTNALYTPLLAAVDRASPYELASRIARLQRTPNFRFSPATMKAGTFTLSNVGVVGGTYTNPVIPPTGQLAIGALGRTRVVAVYRDSQLARAAALDSSLPPPIPTPRLMLPASFTADHRVRDWHDSDWRAQVVAGVELAQLVATFKAICERPERMIGLGA